jgi:hypothetical protein
MKNLIFSIFILISFFSKTFASTDSLEVPKNKTIRKARTTFLDIGLGTGKSHFRDFATSPLIYNASPIHLSLGRWKYDEKRTSYFNARYCIGFYSVSVGDEHATSVGNTFIMNHTQLYTINKFSSPTLKIQLGWHGAINANLRINSSLQNNALGMDFFSTSFASAKIIKDLSRKEPKEKKRRTLTPRKRLLSYQLNIGVMNNTFRNGYAYIGQSAVLNNLKVFEHYEHRYFSGFRMSSTIDYILYSKKNNNAIKFSYLWDAYKTGGNLDKFEMAHHAFLFSLLYNIK